MNQCHTCGGDIGEHLGECPEGSQALWEANAAEASSLLAGALRLHGWTIPIQKATIAELRTEYLRLRVEEVTEQIPLL